MADAVKACGPLIRHLLAATWPDDLHIVSGSRDTSVRIWDVETTVMVAKAEVPLNVVTDVKWVPGTRSLVAQVSSPAVLLWTSLL